MDDIALKEIDIENLSDMEKELLIKMDMNTLKAKTWLKKMGYRVYSEEEYNKLNQKKAILITILTVATWIIIILILSKTPAFCGA